jgi:polyhydroxybutyrate depolymerase
MRKRATSLLLSLQLVTACAGNMGMRSETSSENQPEAAQLLSTTPTTAAAKFAADLDAMCRKLLTSSRRTFSIMSSGIKREFIVQSPKRNCNAKQPLILVFHGGGGEAKEAESVSPFQAEAKKHGMLVVYPNGIDKTWNDGRRKEDGEPISTSNDVQFVRDLLALFAGTNKADMKRVYSTGHSNGATLTLRLACEMADQIAAFASNAASLPVALKDSCQPSRPVPLLMINGDADTYAPYQGGIGTTVSGELNLGVRMAVEDTVALFAAKNGCGEPTVTSIPDRDAAYGAAAKRSCVPTASQASLAELRKADVRKVYGCNAGAEVQLIKVVGGGHTWPNNPNSCFPLLQTGTLTVDFDMSATAVAFFNRFKLP